MWQSDCGIVPSSLFTWISSSYKLVRSEPMQSGIVPGPVGRGV